MKAAVVTGFDRPLSIEDVPVPVAGPEQVLVRIETCGLCHTDIHAARGDWPIKPTPPFIPGHEGVGIVERLGAGNSHGLSVGHRVALPWLGYSCGDCRHCNSGWETLCESQLNMGYSMNGGFAEYTVGNAGNVVRVPEDVDPLDAAPLTCAGVTTYKAVKVSGARASSVVAVFGAGGLGHLAIQYARVTGAAVIALEEVFERHRRGGTRAAHRVPARRPQRGHRAGSRRQRAAAAPRLRHAGRAHRSRPRRTGERRRLVRDLMLALGETASRHVDAGRLGELLRGGVREPARPRAKGRRRGAAR